MRSKIPKAIHLEMNRNPKSESASILPDRTCKFLGNLINLGGTLCLNPYTWNSQTRRVVYHGSFLRKILYYAQLCVLIMYEVYLIWRCYGALNSKKVNTVKKIRAGYMTSIYILMNMQHFVAVKQYGRFHQLINNFMNVTEEFKANHGPIPQEGQKKVIRFMKCATFVTVVGCLNFVGAVLSPQSPTMLTSLFKDPKGLPLGVKLAIGALHLAINMFHIYPIAVFMSIVICYVYSILPVVHRMKSTQNGTNNRMALEEMLPDILHKYYCQLAILQKDFNETYGIWNLGMEIWLIDLVVVNIFQAVVFYNFRAVILAMMTGMNYTFLYTEFSRIHEDSSVTLNSWKAITGWIWFKKNRRWYKPLSVTFGGFYFADKMMPLTVLSIIFANAANLIVSYKTN